MFDGPYGLLKLHLTPKGLRFEDEDEVLDFIDKHPMTKELFVTPESWHKVEIHQKAKEAAKHKLKLQMLREGTLRNALEVLTDPGGDLAFHEVVRLLKRRGIDLDELPPWAP